MIKKSLNDNYILFTELLNKIQQIIFNKFYIGLIIHNVISNIDTFYKFQASNKFLFYF